MAQTEAQKRANAKYKANNIKQFKFGFNKVHDADVIERLEKAPNKLGYIKELIRADIAKQAKQTDRRKDMTIHYEFYLRYKNDLILHDEDEWNGKYKTYGEMWDGEGFTIIHK